MGTQLHHNLVQTPTSNGKHLKKWRLAFDAIFFSKTLLYVAKNAVKQQLNGRLLRTLSYTAIDIKTQTEHFDKVSLSKLVEEENLDQLRSFGGVDGVVAALKSDAKNGIRDDHADVFNRQMAFGSNTYERPPAKSLFNFVLKAFKDPMIILAVVCSAFSLGFGIRKHGLTKGWSDGGSIFLAISIVIMASSVSNYWPNRQFNKLSQISYTMKVEVVRSGWRQHIPVDQIVVGDVVCLRIGDKIPADGLFLHGHLLSIDKSSLTMNIDIVAVNCHLNPFLWSGSMVADGYALMLVTSVGMNTKWGKMLSTKWKDPHETTPIQARLQAITSLTSKVGLMVASLVFLVWLVHYFKGEMRNGYVPGKTEFHEVFCEMVGILATVIAIAAGAVAEGLPLAVVITLAYSMKSMTNNHTIVRKHSACEAIASATTICTKLNQMAVTKFWLGQGFIEQGAYSQVAPTIIELLHQAVGLHTTQNSSKVSSFIWTPIEKAIICWAIQEMGMNTRELKETCSILHGEAFDSKKRRGGFLMKKNNDNTIHVHWKGTPEAILAMCSQYYDTTGIVKAIDYDTREKLNHVAQVMATDGLQCVAFAHKKTSIDLYENGISHQLIEDDCLAFIGLVGVKDLCQPGVQKAVEDCQYAGVNIKMVTRDGVLVARAIATECGILKPEQSMESEVVEGAEFQNYTEEERMAKVDKIRVMASASPSDILLMVKYLRQKGHMVAVIGTDTEDAAALREADIGISMGIQAADVAKESSDIVILDDFVSVVNVLKWGRTMFNQIQIFAQFQLTLSITSLAIDFVTAVSASEPPTIKIVATISSGEIPFAALQVLWVKLIMGTLAAVALATGQPSKELMKCPVDGKPLITNIMWRNILAQAIYHVAILLTIHFKGKAIFGVNEEVKDTMMFNTFVLCQVFNKFNARELKKKNIFKRIHKNKLFVGIIGAIIILQVVMVEFLKRFAGTERLNWEQWGASIGIAAMSWPVAWYVKRIPVPNKPFFNYLKWKN
ncbi:hypothetical protein P3X46_006209 [Hevea brasiliensis]|uniref:Calcium-transporting ATPase n=1 Tax=Hevea brasiliensis TaxID=3981 RepID=A0ABQ9MPZ2_HEVBR|nr:putative calcium-transporting ATPase 13, plasma membrane-type [Hevea brasiliensis]KAJ9182186.1 hypothetical protein P3X46_006209 [Hevea brasiliensis]